MEYTGVVTTSIQRVQVDQTITYQLVLSTNDGSAVIGVVPGTVGQAELWDAIYEITRSWNDDHNNAAARKE